MYVVFVFFSEARGNLEWDGSIFTNTAAGREEGNGFFYSFLYDYSQDNQRGVVFCRSARYFLLNLCLQVQPFILIYILCLIAVWSG